VLTVFLEIMLLRGGPREVPPSGPLLAGCALVYFLTSVAQSRLLFGAPLAGLRGLADLALTVSLFGGAVLVCGRRHRLRQTLSAILGTGTLMSLPMIVLVGLRQGQPDDSPMVLALSLLSLPLLVWYLLVISRVMRLALDSSQRVGLALAMSYVVLGYLVVEQLPARMAA
jgi:drug/metabolite transporter (DMT)-like permease